MGNPKIKLGDLLCAFEDAYRAGWSAAIVKADYGEDWQNAFREWLEVTKHKIPEGEDGQDLVAELLSVADTELLIRLRHRLQKKGCKRMEQILTEEIEHREQIERDEAAKHQ